MKNLIVGIDPGKKGGIAFITLDLENSFVFSMPNEINSIITLFSHYKKNIKIAFIEKQHAFPKQGVVSMFNLGMHYGTLIGILATLKIPYEEISPQKWQKVMLGNGRKSRKIFEKLSLQKAKALFPHLASEIGKNHGKSDALLIAEYGRRLLVKTDFSS